MARVDFYILSQPGEQPRQAFACRLAEKAYRLDNRVHIHTASPADEQRLDELLWTFREGSFVPHVRLGVAPGGAEAPVTIGSQGEGVTPGDLLINLGDDIPPCAAGFPRVAELVAADDQGKQLGRKRFASYREQGHTLETHHV